MKPKLGSGTDESSLYFKDGEAGREEVKKHHQASSGLVGFIKNRKRAFSYGSAEHREMCMVVPRDKQHQVLPRASGAEKRDTTQLKVRKADWSTAWMATGPFTSFQPDGSLWKILKLWKEAVKGLKKMGFCHFQQSSL